LQLRANLHAKTSNFGYFFPEALPQAEISQAFSLKNLLVAFVCVPISPKTLRIFEY
jgi:hypothetical protein